MPKGPAGAKLQAVLQAVQAIPEGLIPSEAYLVFTFLTTGVDKFGKFIIKIFNG
jgi:hypothetical protein